MRFLITPHNLRTDALQFCRELAHTLSDAGHQAFVLPETAAAPGWEGTAVWDGHCPVDLLVIAGGDGTVLKNIREIGLYDVPVWGVNFGHLGYLTECEPAQAWESLQKILRGDYTLQERILLQGTILSADGTRRGPFVALNEAYIGRGAMSRALCMDLTISGSFVRSLAADGLIVSTPTGSTAYNFSAGGPLLGPAMDCLAVTPVCPHAALNCAIVAAGSDEVRVRVRLPQEPDGTPLLVADGCQKFVLHDGDEICMSKASQTLKTVKTREENFYARLQRKLAEG